MSLGSVEKIKVAHVTEAWAGGIATYVEGVIKYQSEHPDFDTPHLICSSNRTPKNIDVNNAVVHRYKSSRKPWNILKTAREVQKIIKEIEPDIIHLHSTFAGVYGRLFKLKTNTKIVYCSHGWSFYQEKNTFPRFVYRMMEKYLARNTDAIINISQHEHDIAQRAGVRAKNNYVVMSGVRDVYRSPHSSSPELCNNSKGISSDNPGITLEFPKRNSGNDVNLGFIGRLDYKKGFDVLADAIQSCNRDDIILHVIGKTERNGDYEAPINKKFNYFGWVDYKDLDSYISAFDVVIVPSRQEGFGLVAIEAMRNSKPVIVSDRGALPELVTEGENGFIFPFEQPSTLLNIINNLDKDKLTTMGKNARITYEKSFREERMYEEIGGVYSKIRD